MMMISNTYKSFLMRSVSPIAISVYPIKVGLGIAPSNEGGMIYHVMRDWDER